MSRFVVLCSSFAPSVLTAVSRFFSPPQKHDLECFVFMSRAQRKSLQFIVLVGRSVRSSPATYPNLAMHHTPFPWPNFSPCCDQFAEKPINIRIYPYMRASGNETTIQIFLILRIKDLNETKTFCRRSNLSLQVLEYI
jgi:hypothetical protein